LPSLASTHGLRPVVRETLQTKVYAELRRAIMGGALVPGETITLRGLAEIFGTSITPAREAVNRLIAERALVMLKNRSVIVPQMTRARFEDLTTMRVLLEQQAARVATGRLDTAGMRELQHQNARLVDRLAAGDRHGALAANRDFHFTIYHAAKSDVFSHVIEGLWLQVGPFLVFSMEAAGPRWTTVHHLEVIEAFQARKPAAAARAIAADINETAQQLLKIGIFSNDQVNSFPRVRSRPIQHGGNPTAALPGQRR
jgi:DNA-binding GntR family transcriptional regulator